MSKDIAITKTYDLAKPAEVVNMAGVLKNYVIKQKLYAKIKDKNYAMVEGWQFAGFLSGLTARVESVENLSAGSEIKWKAVVNIYDKSDKLIGVGIALCSSKEGSKKGFDEYAILSMAQTRAIGKAYRNIIGWVMKLAGYESTPSEEMHKVGETPRAPVESVIHMEEDKTPQELKRGQIIGPNGKPTYICSKCDEPITDQVAEFSRKAYGKNLCRSHQTKSK